VCVEEGKGWKRPKNNFHKPPREKKGKHMSIAQKASPSLWESSKERACTEAGLCLHSARKMQWATRDYKQRGGTYLGRKRPSKNRLSRWTRQKWRTSSGKASKGVRRYLPDKAWSKLTPQQIKATNSAKRRGNSKGDQYVRQPEDVARIAAKVRKNSK